MYIIQRNRPSEWSNSRGERVRELRSWQAKQPKRALVSPSSSRNYIPKAVWRPTIYPRVISPREKTLYEATTRESASFSLALFLSFLSPTSLSPPPPSSFSDTTSAASACSERASALASFHGKSESAAHERVRDRYIPARREKQRAPPRREKRETRNGGKKGNRTHSLVRARTRGRPRNVCARRGKKSHCRLYSFRDLSVARRNVNVSAGLPGLSAGTREQRGTVGLVSFLFCVCTFCKCARARM